MNKQKVFKIESGKQISIFLENEPGSLSKVARLLGDNGINMYGLTVAEGIDHGYVRMVVDREQEAVKLLDENGYMAFERDVLLLEISNNPGSFAVVAQQLGDKGVNIEYAYCAGGPNVDRGMVVIYVDKNNSAQEALKELLS